MTPPAGCTISAQQLAAQRDRMRSLAPLAIEVTRGKGVLSLTFPATVDRSLLDLLIAVERRCCSFLGFSYDSQARRLTITVEHENESALDHFVPPFVIASRPLGKPK